MNKWLPSAVLLLITGSICADSITPHSFTLNTSLQIASAGSSPALTAPDAPVNNAQVNEPAANQQTNNVTQQNTSTVQSNTPGSASTQAPAAPATTPSVPIDCNYKISADTKVVDNSIVLKWAEKATQQSFDYDFAKLDAQLAALKSCYTDEGWNSFNDALKKSGNLDIVKKDQLTVSSLVDGPVTITSIKENQWQLSVPLQVVYQNNKEKLTQPLTVDLIVGRTIKGDLGIMQMIASPREDNSNPKAQ